MDSWSKLGASFQHLGSLAGSALQKAGDAVEKGAKIVMERAETAVVGVQYNDFHHAVKRLNETASGLGEGEERKDAMQRWLTALQRIGAAKTLAKDAKASTDVQDAKGSSVEAPTDSSVAAPTDSNVKSPAESSTGERRTSEGRSEVTSEVTSEGGSHKEADGASEVDSSKESEAISAVPSKESKNITAMPTEPGNDSTETNQEGDQAITEKTDTKTETKTEIKTETETETETESTSQVVHASMATDNELVFYEGSPSTCEPLSFRDVFLESTALEHITTSLVAEPGDKEDWTMLRKFFHLCLDGNTEDLDRLVDEVRKLSSLFAEYSESKLSGDVLLGMIADTILSLKLNPELERLHKRSLLALQAVKEKAEQMQAQQKEAEDEDQGTPQDRAILNEEIKSPSRRTGALWEGRFPLLSPASAWLDLQRQQQGMLQRGDTPGDRLLKIEMVTSLARELQESATSAHSSIAECRKQREEALSYRTKRAEENRSAEKVALAALEALHAKKNDLQQQMDEVVASISVVSRQLEKLTEEKEHFYKASSDTVAAFASQGLQKEQLSVAYKGDAEALKEWQTFLELSWPMEQASTDRHQIKLRQECASLLPCMVPLAEAQLEACQKSVSKSTEELKWQIASLEQTAAIRKAFEEQGVESDDVAAEGAKKEAEEGGNRSGTEEEKGSAGGGEDGSESGTAKAAEGKKAPGEEGSSSGSRSEAAEGTTTEEDKEQGKEKGKESSENGEKGGTGGEEGLTEEKAKSIAEPRDGRGAKEAAEAGGRSKRTSGDRRAEELAVMRKQMEQEEDYLLVEYQSTAVAGEALLAVSEIQILVDWASHCLPSGKEKQSLGVLKSKVEGLKKQVDALQGIPRPPLTRDSPGISKVTVSSRYLPSRSWSLESIGAALQGGIVVAPLNLSTKESIAASHKKAALSKRSAEGDPENQLPTPPVISGKRSYF